MRRRVLGATLVAAGLAFHAVPAFADKLDDVLSRLDAIEKNNAKLANENATLKARLNKVETTKYSRPPPYRPAVLPSARPARLRRVSRPRRCYWQHRKSTRTGTAFLSTRKAIRSPSTPPAARSRVTAISTSRSTIRRRRSAEISTPTPSSPARASLTRSEISAGFRRSRATRPISACAASRASPISRRNFVYQLEVGFDISNTPGLKQSNSRPQRQRQRRVVQPQHLYRLCVARIWRHQDRQDDHALRKFHRRLQSVRGPDRRHARHHGQYRRRQPRRIRRPARSLDLVRIADDRRIPVQCAVLAGPEPQRPSATISPRANPIVPAATIPPAADFSRMAVTTARSPTPQCRPELHQRSVLRHGRLRAALQGQPAERRLGHLRRRSPQP